MQPSPKYSLNASDIKEIGLSLLALLGGTTCVFLLSIVSQVDLGKYTALIVLLVTPLLHAAIKWIKDNDTNLATKDLIDTLPGSTQENLTPKM